MTKLSDLPERTFIRRFAKATGLSPLEYVHALRLEEAKQMLETGDNPIEAIARGGLRGRELLQSPVPPQGGAHAGAVSQTVRVHPTESGCLLATAAGSAKVIGFA
ncbi:MAG TPA: helix-turn-helix domain-containing protein [Acetobacteraceae bacterium]